MIAGQSPPDALSVRNFGLSKLQAAQTCLGFTPGVAASSVGRSHGVVGWSLSTGNIQMRSVEDCYSRSV
jgi:hypothetical protein